MKLFIIIFFIIIKTKILVKILIPTLNMLPVEQINSLVSLFPFDKNIQTKILFYILDYGTDSAVQIRKLITEMNQHSISYFYTDEMRTLWRFKLFLNDSKIMVLKPFIIPEVLCELKIAYFTTNYNGKINSNQNIKLLQNLLKKITYKRLQQIMYYS